MNVIETQYIRDATQEIKFAVPDPQYNNNNAAIDRERKREMRTQTKKNLMLR